MRPQGVWLLVIRSLLPLALSLAGCNDRGTGGDGGMYMPPTPQSVPTFTADRSHASSGQIVLAGYGVDPHLLYLQVEQAAVAHGLGMDVLLRIDPQAGATLLAGGGGGWCNGRPAVVQATGNPGEWRIAHHAAGNEFECFFCDSGAGLAAFANFRIAHPGTWRVTLVADTDPELCGCGEGCLSGLEMFGGTVTNPE